MPSLSGAGWRKMPYSLASLTAWYIASTSIEDHSKAGQKWMKAETFLVDLLFHHPGTIHLALLTVARTSHRLFCRLMQHRVHRHTPTFERVVRHDSLRVLSRQGLARERESEYTFSLPRLLAVTSLASTVTSGLGQVIVWLTHYGMWVGQPNVRSDLTKWLAKHLSLRTPPQRPKIFAKNVIALLATEKDEDWLWEAVVGLVVLVRWQGRPWARHHLLPALRTAMDKITNSPSLSSSDRRNSQQNENIKMKISRLFAGALPSSLTVHLCERLSEALSTGLRSLTPQSPLLSRTQ
ncbi:hypothetical protein GWK47_012547 [Chionoecetes opilio]|uniref:Uncharacterized protein n=1 Tax=Chionoecetes opilio TaxID=41210 RepID=A0A8J4Y1Y0_CHIOP|nr:hypothetical protein GWK47_012547 [Chionoecetes opilio]